MKSKTSRAPGTGGRQAPAKAAPTSVQLRAILATTDFSDESLAGVRYAVALADEFGAAVALLHVIEPPPIIAGMEMVPSVRDDSTVTALARTQLERLGERETAGVGHLTDCVRTGKPFHEITTAAGERAADLIVIATHGHTGIKRVLLGSTAERVVRHAPCPVLTVPTRASAGRTGKPPRFKLKKILVPIDFSNVSKAALPWAMSLAKRFGAELILLHVVERFPIDHLMGREQTNETIAPLKQQAAAGLKHLAGSLGKSARVRMSTAVRDGTPAEEICRATRTLGADMIVLTTHGYTGLKHVWLGSTAERVVRHAPCAVFVVREHNPRPL